MANLQNQTVHAGHTIKLKINGMEVGRVQSIEGRRSFGQEPVFEIGSIMPQEHVPLRYEGSINLSKYLIRKKSLADLGLSSLAEGILNIDVIDVEITDRYTGNIVIVYQGCSQNSCTEDFRVGAISGQNAEWVYLRAHNGVPEVVDTSGM